MVLSICVNFTALVIHLLLLVAGIWMAFLDLMRPPATNISQENEGGTQYGKIIIFNKYAFAQKLVI